MVAKILAEEITPNTSNEKYKIDRFNAVHQYERLFKRPISVLQRLLITNPSGAPINQVLIVLAIKLQEVLVEREEVLSRRQIIIDDIAMELMIRCGGLEEELTRMDAELMETGQVEVFAF